MIKQILLVGLGGGIGSILRFTTSVLVAKYFSSTYPLSTFIVNLIGCFLIGLLLGALDQSTQTSQNSNLLLITGFCGGFTTFSAFATDNITLLQHNNYGTALLYIALSVLFGLFAVWLGLAVSK